MCFLERYFPSTLDCCSGKILLNSIWCSIFRLMLNLKFKTIPFSTWICLNCVIPISYYAQCVFHVFFIDYVIRYPMRSCWINMWFLIECLNMLHEPALHSFLTSFNKTAELLFYLRHTMDLIECLVSDSPFMS